MSFGASLSDIIIVVTFCKSLYRKCRDAGGEYDEISREVKGLHIVLRHLKYEIEAPESPLNRDRSIWGQQLAPLIGDCDSTLRQLDTLIAKYGRLGSSSAGTSPSSPRVLWDKVRFGSNEMDQVGDVRVKLLSHKTNLTLFLDTIQLHQSGKMATTLDNHGGQLDIILDKVDGIAARMGQANNGSIMTNYDDDDREVWKQFRRELVAEGFSSDVLQQHKDVLRAYIREIDQKGLLEEVVVDPRNPPTKIGGINPERWLESVQSAPSDDFPPSLRSQNTASSDSSAKEMVIREDNMKFPPSMKMQRPQPESKGFEPVRKLVVPMSGRDRRRSEESQRQQSPVPRLISSDEKEVSYFPATHSSNEDSENDNASRRAKSPAAGQVIKTSELVALSQALTLRPDSPALSYRSQGSFGEEDGMRAMTLRPKKVEFGSSPAQGGDVSNPMLSSPMSPVDRDRTPRPESVRLAPDEHGNEIPPDAKWTRINRRLISPEVLNEDRRRYEARPDFVAILGVLSRSEIEDLASRTAALRHARHLRHHPPQSQQRSDENAPPRPPRPHSVIPIPIPVPISTSSRNRNRPHTLSTDTASSYNSDSSDSNSLNQPRSFTKQKPSRGYEGSDIGVPVSGYPNPYGKPAPPPSPMFSPAKAAFVQPQQQQGVRFNEIPEERSAGNEDYYTYESTRPREKDRERQRSRDDPRPRDRERNDPRQRDRYSDLHRDRERERDQPRSERRKHRHPSHSKPGPEHRERERSTTGGDMNMKGKSRWKENLTAAGIGGAAVSLLNVLSEAAEGI